MRNLEILTKFTASFDEVNELQEDTVATACLDEFGHLIFVYTIGHNLFVYSYNPEAPSVDMKFLGKEEFD